jgi:phosphomannomutase/phosphoglucomutase
MRTLGRAFATLARERGRDAVVVGHDLRTYSARLKDRFVEGAAEAGLLVRDVGCVLTPTLYFSQIHLKTPAGVMITASHNPQGWSGLKMSVDYVTTLLKPDIERLHAIADGGRFASGRGRVETVDVRDAYVADLAARVRIERPLKVVLDAGNGTASYFCVEAYRKAGLEVVPLFCDPDPTFPNHFPNPSELAARAAIRAEVVAKKADLGLSFDGDGDRVGVQDHRGRDVYPDRVLMLLARPVLARRPGAPVVFDVKCTQALVEDITAHGGRPVLWTTGHSWIKSKMKEIDAPIAGERSGHIFIREGFHGYDDGLYAGLRLAEYVAAAGRSLAELLDGAPQYVTSPEIHVDCPDEVKYAVTDRLVAEFKRDYPGRVVDINGARVSFGDGWGLVRPSSNLPELVLVFEGRTAEGMGRIKEEFRRRLARHPEIGSTWHNE